MHTLLVIANNKYQILEVGALIRFLLRSGKDVRVICDRIQRDDLEKLCGGEVPLNIFEIVKFPRGKSAKLLRLFSFRKAVLQILNRCSCQAILSVGLVGRGTKSLALQHAIRNNIPFYVIHATKFHALDQVSSLRGNSEKYVDFSMKNRLFAKVLKNYIISIDGRLVFVDYPGDILFSIILGYSSADKYWASQLSGYPIRLVANQDAKEYVAGFLSGSGGSRVVATGLPR